MKLLAPIRRRLEKDVITRVHRVLRGEGNIYVLEGREVSPEDIIGTSEFFTGYRILNLAKLLAVKPSDVTKYIKRGIGQRIYKDELLGFKKGGFFSRDKIITAPTDGTLDFINNLTGEIRMSLLPKKLNLTAGVYGIVEKVDVKSGLVIIRAQVTKIYGVFGMGRVREGFLQVITKRDGLITTDLIESKFGEYILAGGSSATKDVLNSAISSGINGLVVGGINASDFKTVAGGRLPLHSKLENDIGFSLIVCEGFGKIGMGEDIFEILNEYNGRFISVDGNSGFISLPSFASSSMIRVRGTHLPQLQATVLDNEEKVAEIVEGIKVRIVGSSFTGEQGKVIAIDKTESLMPSRIKSFMVTVETKRRKIQIPYQNIEII